MERFFLATCLCIIVCGSLVAASKVYEHTDPELVPARRGEPVEVTLGLDLTSLREVDNTRGEVEISAMRSLGWRNPHLARRRGEDDISVDIKNIWSPDITAYNAVHAPELLSPPLAIVSYDGRVMYIPNERVRFRCDDLAAVNLGRGANCTLTYGSWTRSGAVIALKVSNDMVAMDDYQENGEFDILGTYAEVVVKRYACCEETYPAARFTLNIRRKRSSSKFYFW